jgi:hypothetical protein
MPFDFPFDLILGTLYLCLFNTYDPSAHGLEVKIAEWRAFGDVVEKMGYKAKEINAINMQKVRERIMDEQGHGQYPGHLRFRMGDEYTKVVLCCLGTIFEDATLSGQEFITTFFEFVVRHLKSLKV